jgi:hypothetical protein
MTLDEFVTARPKPPCWVCALPEVDEINAGRGRGIAVAHIAAWLGTLPHVAGHTHNAIDQRLRKHFREDHKETSAPTTTK